MAHVTFIHGMANKPPPADLLRIWRNTLADAASPLPLGDLGVSSALVYWADLLYAQPDDDLAAHEGVLENTPAAVDAELDAAAAVPAAPQGGLERVPLPWALKKPILDVFLRDVHHYLFDVEFAPPGRQPVPIRRTIRERVVASLQDAAVTRPHVVVAHSLGTVIAYDCLKRVPECAGVDGLITLGSPLGLDEVQDQLRPDWSRADGFPHERLAGEWVNVYDRLDPVCGFDPALADDYRRAEAEVVADLAVRNDGAWRHSITKYLRQATVADTLRRLLRLA